MTPFWSDNLASIYRGRAEDVLPSLGEFAAIVTDPPFGMDGAILNPNRGLVGKRAGRVNDWHPEPDWDGEIDPEWCRLCCDAAPVVAWFGNWRRRAEVESAMPHPIRAEVIWAKDTHVSPPCPLAMQDERIWIFSRDGFKARHFETTVWREPIIPTWAHRCHKNEKPLGLMKRLVRLLCAPGETLCDPFAGSGTTLVAAKLCGVRAIGIEKDEAHCAAAARRLAQGVLEFSPEARPA